MINHQWDAVLIVLLYIYIFFFLNTWKQNHLQFHACCVWYTAIICHYAAIKPTFHIQTIMYFLSLSFFQEPQTTVIHNPVDRNKVIRHIYVSSRCHECNCPVWKRFTRILSHFSRSLQRVPTRLSRMRTLKVKLVVSLPCVRVSARRPAVCCCFPSSICLPSVLLLSHMYILSCLLSSPNLYSSSACCCHSLPPSSFVRFPA